MNLKSTLMRRVVNHRWESFTTEELGAGTLIVGFEHEDSSGNSMYDRAHNKLIEYKTHDATNSEIYNYDSSYRLTSVGSGTQSAGSRGFERGTFTNNNRNSMSTVAYYEDWDLDGVGNWPSVWKNNGTAQTRTFSDFNEIVNENGKTQAHDKNGNLTATGGLNFVGNMKYEYDAFNRLRKASVVRLVIATPFVLKVGEYIYDAANRRMEKTITNGGKNNNITNTSTHYYYHGWRVFEERDGSDVLQTQYVYGEYLDEVWTKDTRSGGVTIADLNDGAGADRYFYHCNTLYNVYGLTDETGLLVEAYEYDTYGRQTVIVDGDANGTIDFNGTDTKTVGGNSTIGNPYMYTGQRFDPETDLNYYKNRYYDTIFGRFISRDPIGYRAGSMGLYEYVGSSIMKYVDPFGFDRLISSYEVITSAWAPSATGWTGWYPDWQAARVWFTNLFCGCRIDWLATRECKILIFTRKVQEVEVWAKDMPFIGITDETYETYEKLGRKSTQRRFRVVCRKLNPRKYVSKIGVAVVGKDMDAYAHCSASTPSHSVREEMYDLGLEAGDKVQVYDQIEKPKKK